METIAVIMILVLYVLMLAAGIYFKSYFDKKGANLATKEDFNELKVQTAALREATKDIESKIDERTWNRQRQWELKRDALLATVSALRETHAAIGNLFAERTVFPRLRLSPSEARLPELEFRKVSSETLMTFNQRRFEASLVCNEAVNRALNEAGNLITACRIHLLKEEINEAIHTWKSIDDAVDCAIDAMRKELGFTPLSNESSVAPSLDLLAPAKDKPDHL